MRSENVSFVKEFPWIIQTKQSWASGYFQIGVESNVDPQSGMTVNLSRILEVFSEFRNEFDNQPVADPESFLKESLAYFKSEMGESLVKFVAFREEFQNLRWICNSDTVIQYEMKHPFKLFNEGRVQYYLVETLAQGNFKDILSFDSRPWGEFVQKIPNFLNNTGIVRTRLSQKPQGAEFIFYPGRQAESFRE